MKKIFIDCGMREGDAIAAFLGNQSDHLVDYRNRLRLRSDAEKFELIGFESPDYRYLAGVKTKFEAYDFRVISKLIWVYDGFVDFDSDGESYDCRIFEVSKTQDTQPWRHPNPNAIIKRLPCIDFASFLLRNYTFEDYVIVKMDIEGAEYDVLKRVIDSEAIFLIKELYVEYHWWGNAKLRESIELFIQNRTDIYYRNDWP